MPVTVRRGDLAGDLMVVLDVGFEPDPVDRRFAIPCREGAYPEVGLARYRPVTDDWVPHTSRMSDLLGFEDWQDREAIRRVVEAGEHSAIEDAARSLRSALQDHRLRGRVSVEGARTILRLSASQAWDLARNIEGASR